jgi:hypothetical protein
MVASRESKDADAESIDANDESIDANDDFLDAFGLGGGEELKYKTLRTNGLHLKMPLPPRIG